MQHFRLQPDVFGRGRGDGVLLGEPVPGVDGVVRVDRVQPYLRGRTQDQGMEIMTFIWFGRHAFKLAYENN